MQVAFQLEPNNFQPLLQCPSITVRILIKSVLAFMSTHREIPDIKRHTTLHKDEVIFIAESLTDILLHSGMSEKGSILSSAEEILYLLRSLTSCPCDKSCCALPILLDTLTSTCLSVDKNIANVAMEVLWNLSFDPVVSFAILNHEAAVYSLQSLTFSSGRTHISTNILWTLGCGTIHSESRLLITLYKLFTICCNLPPQVFQDAMTMHLLVTIVGSTMKLSLGVIMCLEIFQLLIHCHCI